MSNWLCLKRPSWVDDQSEIGCGSRERSGVRPPATAEDDGQPIGYTLARSNLWHPGENADQRASHDLGQGDPSWVVRAMGVVDASRTIARGLANLGLDRSAQ